MLYTCAENAAIFWSYRGDSRADAEVIVFTDNGNSEVQSELLTRGVVNVQAGFVSWPFVNVPGGRYRVQVTAQDTNIRGVSRRSA